jgi:hypothetical protein
MSTIEKQLWMKSSRSGMKAIRLFNQQTLGFMAFHADEMRMMRPSDVKAMSTAMMGHRSVLCTPNRQDEPGLMSCNQELKRNTVYTGGKYTQYMYIE